MVDKLILTNRSVLKAKYGTGLSKIDAALKALVAADKARDLATKVVDLGDAVQMKALKAPAVKDSTDPAQNKAAIDGVYNASTPDYVVLLGAIDVIPHQDVRNPVYSPPDDDDRYAFGDLPYACDKPYGREAADFTGPTRVVGRIPDLNGGTDPAYIVGLLSAAASWAGRPRSQYERPFGITAWVWRGSTGLSLKAVFGSATDLKTIPPGGPSWPAPYFSRRSHFINCHGAPVDFHFYGQKGTDYPPSLDATLVAGKVAQGTVVAAECCYGAQLYAPKKAKGQAGISSTYLAGGAHGFFGSSTIAYGPANGNGSADLICQFFLKHILEGASLGRAALQARQDFARSAATLDPTDLKTLAQFSLLGDPSITPVATPAPPAGMAPQAKAFALTAARSDRRRGLARSGLALSQTVSSARRTTTAKPSPKVRKEIESLMKAAGMKATPILSFEVKTPALPKAFGAIATKGLAKAAAGPASRIHVIVGKRTNESVPNGVALVVREEGGRVVSAKKLQQH
jgi:Peptidase family C25